MNSYEVLYIITPELDEEANHAVIEKFKAIVADNGAEVVAVDEWGKRKLAYEIDYKKEGTYVLMSFNSNPDFPRELDDAVARRKLKAMGVEIDSLSREQEAYLGV